MSVYTTQVRWIVESGSSLALQNYPIFDEAYRAKLNQKIQDHFYFREIGFETVGLFNNRLAARMNEIMPYFNELYKTTGLITNPVINRLYKESFTRQETGDETHSRTEGITDTDKGSQSSTSSGSGQKSLEESRQENQVENTSQSSKTISSDTPQGILPTADVFTDPTWASQAGYGSGTGLRSENASTSLSDTETTSQQARTTQEDSRDHQRDLTSSGKDSTDRWETFERSLQGLEGTSQAALVMEFRQSLINIDMMVIEALEDLFMQIW